MNVKKLILILSAFGIALSATLGSWVLVSAAKKDESITRRITFEKVADVYLANSGVYFPGSAYTAAVELTRFDADNSHPARDLDFFQRWMDVRIYSDEGDEFERVFGLIYVYFNLNNETLKEWKAGELSIYYYDPDERAWVECPSRLVANKNMPYGRITCVISEFGLYGLATPH